VAQGEGPEFKPQYCKKKKKIIPIPSGLNYLIRDFSPEGAGTWPGL
jgi:hypothetical protein